MNVKRAVASLKLIKVNTGMKNFSLVCGIVQNAPVVEIKHMRRKENSYEGNFIQRKEN